MHIQPEDTVRVRLYDARVITAQVCKDGIAQTVSGTKVRVRSRDAVLTVDAGQILEVIEKAKP